MDGWMDGWMSVGTEIRYAADVSPVVVVGFTVNLSLSSSFLLSNAFSVLMVGRESGQGGEEPCISVSLSSHTSE